MAKSQYYSLVMPNASNDDIMEQVIYWKSVGVIQVNLREPSSPFIIFDKVLGLSLLTNDWPVSLSNSSYQSPEKQMTWFNGWQASSNMLIATPSRERYSSTSSDSKIAFVYGGSAFYLLPRLDYPRLIPMSMTGRKVWEWESAKSVSPLIKFGYTSGA